MVRAVVGIGGMGDLVSYLCKERLAKALGFEKELTFVNPIADLLKEFSESMVNDLLQETVRLLVKCGVQLGEVVAVDGSFLHVFGKKYEKAERGYSGHLGKTALGYKLHLAYDAQLRLPIAMTVTPGNVSDAKALETLRNRIVQAMGKRPNQMFLLDRGYFDAAALHQVDRDDALFVCRAKMWPKYITTAVEELREKDFLFRAKKYRVATTLVIEPTTDLLLRLVVVRHVTFPKPLVLVTNATDLRPVQVYRLYKKRFTVEAAFHELRHRWHLNRFVGNTHAQVVGHIGIAVLGLTLHRCFRFCLQRRTKAVGIKTLRRTVYEKSVPDVPQNLSNRQLSRRQLQRIERELVKFIASGATKLKTVLMHLLGTSIPKPRILIESCTQP